MDSTLQERGALDDTREFDAVVVGAGFAGLYALARLRSLGLRVRVFEAGGDVGGTWYWNCYPGARCDVPSFEYSFSFDPTIEQEWQWTEKYAAQPEILAYMRHVAERHDLKRDIRFETRVTGARFREETSDWVVSTDKGEEVTGRFLIMATGSLSVPNDPRIEGADEFAGVIVHTGQWPQDGLDVAGKRVGVIGTGSSGIQVAPELAKVADRLYLIQRTPAYSVPSRNRVLAEEEIRSIKQNYGALRAETKQNRSGLSYVLGENRALEVDEETRRRIFEERWKLGGLAFTAAFRDIFDDVEANRTAQAFVRDKIREIVKDPETARKLMPDTLIGCKRLCVDNGYFEMFNRTNVELVDLRERPIRRISPTGLVLADGEIPLDVIVYATGFDAMTGAMLRIDVRGRGGRQLREKWAHGPVTFLGLGVAGFPNLFTVSAPGSPAGLANMVSLIEENVAWIAECIGHMEANGLKEIEADPEAEIAWGDEIQELANKTIYPLQNSWYVGSNIPGKPRVFMSHLDFPRYNEACRRSAAAGYTGFHLR